MNNVLLSMTFPYSLSGSDSTQRDGGFSLCARVLASDLAWALYAHPENELCRRCDGVEGPSALDECYPDPTAGVTGTAIRREQLLKHLAPCPRRHRTRGQRIDCYRRRLSPGNAVRIGHHDRKSAGSERTRRCGKQQVEVVIQSVSRYLRAGVRRREGGSRHCPCIVRAWDGVCYKRISISGIG